LFRAWKQCLRRPYPDRSTLHLLLGLTFPLLLALRRKRKPGPAL
jgi:hypothetical protein